MYIIISVLKIIILKIERILVLHALVNNAARMVMAEYEWQTIQMIREQFEVNVLGPIMLTAQLLPAFRKNKSKYFYYNYFCIIIYIDKVNTQLNVNLSNIKHSTILKIKLQS